MTMAAAAVGVTDIDEVIDDVSSPPRIEEIAMGDDRELVECDCESDFNFSLEAI